MSDTIKHIRQLLTDFLKSLIYFNLVSCLSKNQVPYFILDKGWYWLKKKQQQQQQETKTKNKNKTNVRKKNCI